METIDQKIKRNITVIRALKDEFKIIGKEIKRREKKLKKQKRQKTNSKSIN